MAIDVEAYLRRINYDGPREPSAGALRTLQVAHLCAVPFENFSIHRGEPIALEEERLFESDRHAPPRRVLL